MKITKKRFNEITKLALQEAIIRIVQEELVSDDEGEATTPAVNPVPTPGTAEQPAFSPDDQAAIAAEQKTKASALQAKIMNLVHGVHEDVAAWFEPGLAGMIGALVGAAEKYEPHGGAPEAPDATGTAE